MSVGRLQLYPTFGAALGYDDNVTLSNDGPISSRYLLLEPGVRAELTGRRSRLRAQYRLSDGDFADSDRDDFTDQFFDLGWGYQASVRSEWQIDARWHEAHDRRGEALRENFDDTLDRDVDEYRDHGLGVTYRYGASGARGRLAVFADLADRRYLNNRDFTREGDFEQSRIGGEFSWRTGARTTALVQASRSDIDYDVNIRDSVQRQLALGLRWDGAPTSDARLLVGRLERSAQLGGQADFQGLFWEAAASWRPLERSEFTLLTGRATDEAFGGASFLVRERHSLGWRHQWRSRLSSSLDLSWAEEDLRPNQRADDIQQVGLSVDYTFRRWMLVGLGWRHVERRSSSDRFDYRRNEVLLSMQVSL
ncbi:MAG: outer membrane beta-barrel protein [Pseudomonadota bacterium]